MNFNLVNDQHPALEISDLSNLTMHFGGTVAERQAVFTFYITIIFGGYCYTPKVSKPCPM
jgi:hypothetical protein